jgi:hypothetical protein
MINIKSADLTNPAQKFIALCMLGLVLLILYFLLPPLITILANIWLAVGLAVPLFFLIYNYEAVWSLFKRLSWNMTKKLISSDKLWYLWQGYNYLVKENELMEKDIDNVVKSRLQSEKMLSNIVKDSNRAKQEAEIEKSIPKLRVIEVKVKMLNDQFNNIEPKVQTAKLLEKDLRDYYENRLADTEILKINLEAKAQEYTLYKDMANATKNASRWMKESSEMRMFNESLKQIDDSLNEYTANIESFKRNILPKMSSDSTSRTLDAQEGAKLIEEYKKNRLNLQLA